MQAQVNDAMAAEAKAEANAAAAAAEAARYEAQVTEVQAAAKRAA